jgi:hypothetical protein
MPQHAFPSPPPASLMSITAVYVQDADGDQDGGGSQELKLSMTTCGDAPYLVIETQRWAVDRPKEITRLVKQFAAQVEALFDVGKGD